MQEDLSQKASMKEDLEDVGVDGEMKKKKKEMYCLLGYNTV
jgi:hypothetical protein